MSSESKLRVCLYEAFAWLTWRYLAHLASVQPLEQYIGAKQQEKKKQTRQKRNKTEDSKKTFKDLQRNARKAMESRKAKQKGEVQQVHQL